MFSEPTSPQGLSISEAAAAAVWTGSGFLVGTTDNGTYYYPYEGSDTFTTDDPKSAAASVGLDDAGTAAAMASLDYDADGLNDIYVANTTGKNRLFKNNGDGTYSSVEEEANAVELGNDGSTDVDVIYWQGSSFPSLYISDNDGDNHFYINNGDGTFTDTAEDLSLQDPGSTRTAAWTNDMGAGYPVMALGRWDQENLLYYPIVDESGTITSFQDLAPVLGMNETLTTIDMEWTDTDADGDQDLLAVSYDDGIRLYENESKEVSICPKDL